MGHYEFKLMPSKLTNAPTTLQSSTNQVLRHQLRQFVLVLFYDIWCIVVQ